jgi:hypothetical protein
MILLALFLNFCESSYSIHVTCPIHIGVPHYAMCASIIGKLNHNELGCRMLGCAQLVRKRVHSTESGTMKGHSDHEPHSGNEGTPFS